MARTLTAVKEAAKNHKGRVLSSIWSTKSNGHNLPVEAIRSNQEWFARNRRAVVDSLANLLPIEEGMRANLEENLAGTDELLSALKPRAHRYPILSLEPLTWRDEKGYPKLVLLAIDQLGMIEISGISHSLSNRKSWRYRPLIDDHRYDEVHDRVIKRCYQDVGELLQEKAFSTLSNRTGDAVLSIKMELGNLLIPPKTRAKIAKARKFFGDQIFLIAEAKGWVEDTVVRPDPDPLVVGYEDGLLFLIDVFDLKPIEGLALEFSTPQ